MIPSINLGDSPVPSWLQITPATSRMQKHQTIKLLVGTSAMSRSSAKHLLAPVDRFDDVLVDFRAVRSIGPAFADEIFRVFALQHPNVQLIAINANEQVTGMIRRAQAEAARLPDS